MEHWRPSASLDRLKTRADLLRRIRSFFSARQVLEVDVPVLAATGVTDLHIENIRARVNGVRRYLQSSPEYYLKRLLAAGSGPVFYLGKAFRDGESGRRHNPEFTLLEWYRPGWTEHQLMAETSDLLAGLAPAQVRDINSYSYRQIFVDALGLDPHTASLEQLQILAAKLAGAELSDWQRESRSGCLDLLFSLGVEPRLPPGLVYIYDYPACQAALAQLHVDDTGTPVARRFEAFLNGMELANGYFELTDPGEQRARFAEDMNRRQAMGKAPMIADERLLAALDYGLPPSAGIALGVDRLLMQMVGADSIGEVISFID